MKKNSLSGVLILLTYFTFVTLIFVASGCFIYSHPWKNSQTQQVLGTSAAETIYVSTGGSDTGRTGLSAANYPGSGTGQPCAFRTIQKGATVLGAGDTLTVLAGTYNEDVVISNSGTNVSRITVQASGAVYTKTLELSGSYITLKGFTVTPTDCQYKGAIQIIGDYNIAENNLVENSPRQGILVRGVSNGSIVRNNTIRYTYNNGIVCSGTNNLIEDNDIGYIVDQMSPCTELQDVNGIEFTGTGNTYRGNYIHDLRVDLQAGTPHMDAFQTYGQDPQWGGAAKNTIIEGNYIFMGNTTTGVLERPVPGISVTGFMLEGQNDSNQCENLTIRNNIIMSHVGICTGGGGKNLIGLKIYNNTFKGDLGFVSDTWPTAINLNDWEADSNVNDCEAAIDVRDFQIYNNIMVDYHTHSSSTHLHNIGSCGTYGNNLFWNSDGSTPKVYGYILQPTDKMKINPLFISTNNFHLQSTSPAIDAGLTISSITNDYDGVTRPQFNGYDIGAFEYYVAPQSPPQQEPQTPNEGNEEPEDPAQTTPENNSTSNTSTDTTPEATTSETVSPDDSITSSEQSPVTTLVSNISEKTSIPEETLYKVGVPVAAIAAGSSLLLIPQVRETLFNFLAYLNPFNRRQGKKKEWDWS
ncbi:hypothetical protein JW962_02845 [Candidatus Dojkabacteria bacterium]|nr:hypothetical protein [Candidatus Dojkabacteria bacterium]